MEWSLLTVNGFFFPTDIFFTLGVHQGTELDQGVLPVVIIIIFILFNIFLHVHYLTLHTLQPIKLVLKGSPKECAEYILMW